MNTMFSWLNRKVADKKVEKELKVTKAVYRDGLTNKNKSPPHTKAVKKSVRFADSEASIFGEDSEKNLVKGSDEIGGIRVKVKMTKAEATRLLSKCKEGGVIEFNDVARELVALPLNRVSVVSSLHQP
ncbi:hypothetical protein Fmac_001960 [Flemingia macrophylla]|uniref:DUF7890 domain-containing protein n=1 Tax=Flemingia macrophylla TaxID=520843 RepID=A0ABD1NLC3_9FABA